MALKFRRGTTAQKSGSLAFGEPYVNTTLGTLQIGGESADITLSAIGTGSNIAVAGISGSSLDITGNAKIDGNLTVGGQLQIGDQTSDTVNVVASLSSSLIPQTTNAFDLGSASKIWRDLYISTGSIKFIGNGAVVGTLSSNASGDLITSGALIISSGSTPEIRLVNRATGMEWHIIGYDSDSLSIHNSRTGRSTFRIDSGSTGFHTHMFGDVYAMTGSLYIQQVSASIGFSGSVAGIGNVTAYSSSVATQFSAIGNLTSSNAIRLTNLETFSGSENTKSTTLGTYTGSVETRFTTLGTLTGSNAIRLTNLESTTASLAQRIAANEAVSGTFARTNSTNTFNGAQTVSGSLTVTQDLIVLGSSSIQNISSSNLAIGAAYVTLNTFSPSSRFAGINIIDSGSSGGSGSLWYDAVQDEFIQIHKGNGTNVTSSHFVQGPQTYDNLGNETYLTNNRLTKGTGLEHIVDSQITDDGSTVTIPGALTVTGNITGPIRATNGVVSGSSQIDGSQLGSNKTITIGSTSTTLGGTSTTLAGLTSVSSTGFTGALTGNASTATTLATARTINGTSFNGSADITIPNLVSGSLQIDATATTNWATGIKTRLDANAVISGSSQVAIASTNGFGTYLNQAVLSSSSPTFAGLTINGAITATGDITAYYSSDKRYKNNIQIIPNALEKVSKLNGVTWEWNDDVNEVTKQAPKTGLIAQEVLEVLPEVVKQKEDGFLGLDYAKMIGLLVEAIKEQQSQIEELKAQIGSK